MAPLSDTHGLSGRIRVYLWFPAHQWTCALSDSGLSEHRQQFNCWDKKWMKTEVAGRSLVCSRVLVPHWGNPRRERKRRPHLLVCSQWLTQLAFLYSPGPLPGVELPTEVWALLSQLWVRNVAHRRAPGRSVEGSSLIEIFWGDSLSLTKTK